MSVLIPLLKKYLYPRTLLRLQSICCPDISDCGLFFFKSRDVGILIEKRINAVVLHACWAGAPAQICWRKCKVSLLQNEEALDQTLTQLAGFAGLTGKWCCSVAVLISEKATCLFLFFFKLEICCDLKKENSVPKMRASRLFQSAVGLQGWITNSGNRMS